MSSYSMHLQENDYEVTPDQRATHKHILDSVVPARRDLAELVRFLDSHGALDQDEAAKLREAVRVLEGLCVPMALLKEVEDPRQAAASRMFSSMLRSRSEPEADEDEDNSPSMGR
jgi:hypothetical protein